MGVPPAGHRRAAKSCGGAFHPPESGQLLTGLVTPGERLTYRSFGGHPLKQPPRAARTTIFPQAVREASTTCMCPIGSQLQSVPRPIVNKAVCGSHMPWEHRGQVKRGGGWGRQSRKEVLWVEHQMAALNLFMHTHRNHIIYCPKWYLLFF